MVNLHKYEDKIRACKALQGKTVNDIIGEPKFRDNLAAYMKAQRDDRAAIRSSYEAMRKAGGAKGYKLPAHVCDRVLTLSVSAFAVEFARVLVGRSALSFAERQYIRQLGMQAYNLTMAQYIVAEFPELEDELIPKSAN